MGGGCSENNTKRQVRTSVDELHADLKGERERESESERVTNRSSEQITNARGQVLLKRTTEKEEGRRVVFSLYVCVCVDVCVSPCQP